MVLSEKDEMIEGAYKHHNTPQMSYLLALARQTTMQLHTPSCIFEAHRIAFKQVRPPLKHQPLPTVPKTHEFL